MKPLADISIFGSDDEGYGWACQTDDGTHNVGRTRYGTPTDALWCAVDSVRDGAGELAGVLAIHAYDTLEVAHAPLWCVPNYPSLCWSPTSHDIDLQEMS